MALKPAPILPATNPDGTPTMDAAARGAYGNSISPSYAPPASPGARAPAPHLGNGLPRGGVQYNFNAMRNR